MKKKYFSSNYKSFIPSLSTKSNYLMLLIIQWIWISPIIGQSKSTTISPYIPDIVTLFPNVRDLAISPFENELYFTIQSRLEECSSIAYCQLKNGNWTKPEIAAFSGKYQDMEPFFTPDGLKLFFVSNRPLKDTTTESKDFDIWYIERTNKSAKWSRPINIGSPINTNNNEFYPSLSSNHNLYFTSDGTNSKGKDDIFMSTWDNGIYSEPISLSDSINSTGFEFNAFIAPDESFLLYTAYNRTDGLGSGDLYVSFNKKNNIWTKSIHLGKEINSSLMDYCPYYNAKSKILYFTSKRSSVTKQFNKPQNIQAILREINQYENGQSRLYQIPFDPSKYNTTMLH
ncbi:MAG: PD40 domain-containing protein [Saprospiraceae bacterium]|nr:PD40 domain-containing protein [Saprospiraceae bacterium]